MRDTPNMQVLRSNRLEALVAALARDVDRPPPALVGTPAALVEPETIVVQSRGMERWVAMELARRVGVWANPRFVFPRAVVGQALRESLGADPEQDRRWERDALTWAVARWLPDHLDDPAFAALRGYLAEPDPRGRRAVQLAGRISYLFDQYVVYRPDMVLAWESGADTGAEDDTVWQPRLWRRLHAALGRGHFAHRVQDFLQAAAGWTARPRGLPHRLSLFGVTTLPPVFLDVLAALARFVAIRIYHPAPSAAWFADDRPLREILRLEAKEGRSAEELHLEQGHPLLASMGRVPRDFQFLLAGLPERAARDGQEVEVQELDDFVDPGDATALHRLQADILRRETRTGAVLAADDRSVVVHRCHGPMREVEALRDQLLELLRTDDTLRPRDIIVMMPDVEAYAPFLEAVFGVPEGDAGYLPYRLADRSPRSENGVVEGFLGLLDVARGRLGAPQVLDLLALAPVRERFGIAAEDVPLLREWASAAGIRWAEDAAHRASVRQPADPGNTWRFGLDRLLLGFAMPDAAHGPRLWAGTLPFPDMEGAEAALMGRFVDACEQLFALRGSLAQARPLAGWRDLLTAAAERFLHQDAETAWQHQAVREALSALADRAELVGFTEAVSLEVVKDELEMSFAEPGAAHGFLSGGVTFCALLPMRSIPFRVVGLLGMNDDAFPRTVRTMGFDLVSQRPRRGDRSVREDDRTLFLEALLSARDHVVVTYTGLGIQDNKARPPSTCVSELLDALGAAHVVEGAPPPRDLEAAQEQVRARLVTSHAIQPFSAVYFQESPDDPRYSYAHQWCAGAQALLGRRQDPPVLLGDPLPAVAEDELSVVDLGRLEAFLTGAARGLLRDRVGLRLGEELLVLGDREPFDLAPLSRWSVGDRLLELALDGVDPADGWDELKARGVLPLGTPGRLAFDDVVPGVRLIAERVAPLRSGARRDPAQVDVACGPTRLVGAVEHLWPTGRVTAGYARLGAARRLSAWVQHLALLCAEPEPDAPLPRESFAVGRGASGALPAVVRFGAVEDAAGLLADLVGLWRAGQDERLPLLCDAGLAYATARREGATVEAARTKARVAFSRSYRDGDAWFQRAWEGADALDGPDEEADPMGFAGLSLRVFGPMLDHEEGA